MRGVFSIFSTEITRKEKTKQKKTKKEKNKNKITKVKSHLAKHLPSHVVVPPSSGGSEPAGAVSAAPWGQARAARGSGEGSFFLF